MGAVLAVQQSISARFWRARPTVEREALAIAQQLQLPDILGRLLAQRQQTLESAPRYLAPKLREFLPDPSKFKDMDKAADYLAAKIMNNEDIGLLGDYDVDGATSAALLIRFFRMVGVDKIHLHVPDRQKEGYGPNITALRKLAEKGARTIITLDCGIVAFDALEQAANAGVDVLIVDHHIAESRLPKAVAIVNPNRLDDESGYGYLAAVGVAFLLAVAINRSLKKAGWYSGRPEPNLLNLLDLVALGTICDVVPLIGANRALASQGLKVLGQRQNPGLAALADQAGLDEVPGAYHAGYVLGPRINAGGRVGQSDLGALLLSSDDALEVKEIALQLDLYNDERRAIESQMLDQALLAAETKLENGHRVLLVSDQKWHPGIVGIIASRLKDRYARPACAIALDASGRGRGSGRSIPGFHLGNAIIAARESGLLIKGGGHAMAAGFEIEHQNIPSLYAFLDQRLSAMNAEDLMPILEIDGLLQPKAVNKEFCSLIDQLGPFGSGNPQPVFVLPDIQIQYAEPVGQGSNTTHLRCQLVGSDGARLKAMVFRAVGTPLGNLLLQSRGQRMHLAGTIKPDNWNGRNGVYFVIEDAALA